MTEQGIRSQLSDRPEEMLVPPTPLLGVEEEYLLVDPGTRRIVTRSTEAVGSAASRLGGRVTTELGRCQVEAQTPPCAGAGELRLQLEQMRSGIAAAVAATGLRVIATGTDPAGDALPMQVTEGPRYQAQLDTYRGLVREHVICAAHVHVCIPDREQAVLVSNHLRPWLPLLTALTANSPFFAGQDTGYASWRRLMWARWPASGPPPYFSCYDDYRRLVDTLVDSGTLPDERTLFWDIRLSSRFPTLEVRAADVPMTAEESGLLAALVGALACRALQDVERGDPGPAVSPELLQAACWRAARDGLRGADGGGAGGGGDPRTGAVVDPRAAIPALVEHIRPVLDPREQVTSGLRRLLAAGTGADRQRAAYARRGLISDVVDLLVAHTPDGSLG